MKRATLTDVAIAAGVSRSAAARALLGTGGDHVRIAAATRKRIEAAARRLRYAPNRSAQQLRGLSSKTIGVILDTENLPVMSQRVFALEAEAGRRGYRLLIGHTHGQEDRLREYVADFTGRDSEAIFCLFDLTPDRDERVRQCFGNFKNIVFHGRAAWAGGYCVRVDTELALSQCVSHLVSRGKKRLALFLPNRENDELLELRKNAFLKAAEPHDLSTFIWDASFESREPNSVEINRGIDFIIGQCKADAILASNDVFATRFILQLQTLGLRIPRDVAVVGYDNLDIAEVVSPALTTIDQCHEDYARVALNLLQDLISQKKIPLVQRTRTIEPRLIIRESA